MKSPRTVFFCQVFPPDNQSTAQLFGSLWAALAERGHRMAAVVGYPAIHFGAASGKVAASENWRGVEIERVGASFSYKQQMWKRLLHYAMFLLGTTAKIVKYRKDRLLASTNPPFLPVWMWLVTRVIPARYDLFLLDIFPDGLVRLGEMKAEGLLHRVWRRINRYAFARAEIVLVLGRDMGDYLRSEYGVAAEKIHYIPHWSLVETPVPLEARSTDLWKKEQLRDEFVVQYSGNMGLWHDMETIIRAAHRLCHRDDIVFLLIGEGRRRAGAEALARELQLSNVRWLPFQPEDTLLDSLSACDIALVSQRKNLEGMAVPCKLYGILAAGRGILGLAPVHSELGLVIEEEGLGLQMASDDDKTLAEWVGRLADDRSIAVGWGTQSHRAYHEKYLLKHAAARFEQFVLSPHRPTS